MLSRRPHRPLAAALLFVATMRALSAFAQEVNADERDYNAVVADAMHEFDAGRFEEARALFVRAHALRPGARTLRGLGFTDFELRHYVAADRALRASLGDTRNQLKPAQRKDVEELLVRIRELVGRYRIVCDPASATLSVDNAPATVDPDGTLLLEVGEHTLVASAPMRDAWTRRIDVLGGEQTTLQITLALATPSAANAPNVAAAQLAPATSDSTRYTTSKASVLPWLLVGGSAAIAVTGVVLFVLGRGDASSVENVRDGATYASIRGAQNHAPLLSNVGIVLAASGFVGVGVGTVLLTKRAKDAPQTGPTAMLSVSPLGLRLHGAL